MTHSTTFHLHVEPYRLEGSRIYFSWTVDPTSDLFRNHEVFFEYVDIDLEKINSQTWYAMFFAHIAKAADESGAEWILHFPIVMSASHLLPWANYLELSNVYVAQDSFADAADLRGHEPRPNSDNDEAPIAVLLGGGKDSMFTLALLGEIYGRKKVIATTLAHHPRNSQQHRIRHQAQLIGPLIEQTGVPTLYIQTSVRNCFSKRVHSRSSGLVLYFATLLPYLVTGTFRTITFSYEMTLLYVQNIGGIPVFAHERSRWESITRLAAALSDLYATRVRILNINSALSKHGAFSVLVRRYPEYLGTLFMCEATLDRDTKWCGQCWKCFEYVLMCLIEKTPCEIDIDTYMAEARYIQNVFKTASGLKKHVETGNLCWSNTFGGHPVHYGTMCHSFAHLDMDYVRVTVSIPTAAKLESMKEWFGNYFFALFDGYVRTSLQRLPISKITELEAIVSGTISAYDDENEPFLCGDEWVSLRTDLQHDLTTMQANDLVAELAT